MEFIDGLTRSLNLGDIVAQLGSEDRLCGAQADEEAAAQISWWIQRHFGGSRRRWRQFLSAIGACESMLSPRLQSRLDPTTLIQFRPLWRTAADNRYADASSQAHTEELHAAHGVCEPVVQHATTSVSQALTALPESIVFDDVHGLTRQFIDGLRARLADAIMPALVLELNLAGLGASLTAAHTRGARVRFARTLWGDAPRRRFWSKYPVLWRLVSTITLNGMNAFVETMRRVAADRAALSAFVGARVPLRLRSVQLGMGESHCGGRVVSVLDFDAAKVVYKPRSVAPEALYNRFLNWYASVAPAMPPRCFGVLERTGYGYTEFIENRPAASMREIEEFYAKAGTLLAISWLLGLTDMHHENLIACGGDPFLVDVETMFDRDASRDTDAVVYDALLRRASSDLLFSVGLLPLRTRGPSGTYDMSGLGARGEQPLPVRRLGIERARDGTPRLAWVKGRFRAVLNAPVLEGHDLLPADFTSHVVGGFDAAMATLATQRRSLKRWWRQLCENDTTVVRWVPRSTLQYVSAMNAAKHPTVLGQAIERDLMLGGALSRLAGETAAPARLVGSELADMWNGDVPYFSTTPSSLDLSSATGLRFRNFFERSGLDSFCERIDSIGACSVAQRQAIRLSLASTQDRVAPSTECTKGGEEADADGPMPPAERLTALARELARDVLDQAVYVEGTPFWAGLHAIDEQGYGATVLPPCLYDGAPGIGLFLAYLYRRTRSAACRSAAMAVRRAVEHWLRTPPPHIGVGAFNGLAGLIFAELHLAAALGEPATPCIDSAFRALLRLLPQDESYDVVSGAAGALIVSLRYFRATRSIAALRAARAAARRLRSTAERQPVGVAWHTLKEYDARLGGLAHGVAGIAWALSEWTAFVGGGPWQRLAQDAFEYQKTLYDAQRQTWRDPRDSAANCSWCYGAPGIGLVASRMRATLGDVVVESTLRAAAAATWRGGWAASQGLCHGNLGNLEVFRALGHDDAVKGMLRRALKQYAQQGFWDCGLPRGVTHPGLMTGLAGVGYALLRCAMPSDVPNVLLLDPPPEGPTHGRTTGAGFAR